MLTSSKGDDVEFLGEEFSLSFDKNIDLQFNLIHETETKCNSMQMPLTQSRWEISEIVETF